MKKLMGSDDNPFTGILKSFMQSQLGAGLGAGLGDAIRARSQAPVQAPPPALPPPSRSAEPQTLPAKYIQTYEPRLVAATDDADLVSCVVDSLLSLATEPHWVKLSTVFLEATVKDDLAQVNQLLFAFFNVWGQSGSTVSKEKTDAAIRAVNTSWDVIVPRVCELAGQPLPETYKQRRNAAAAAAEKSAANGQSGPSASSSTPASGDAVQA